MTASGPAAGSDRIGPDEWLQVVLTTPVLQADTPEWVRPHASAPAIRPATTSYMFPRWRHHPSSHFVRPAWKHPPASAPAHSVFGRRR